MVKKGLILFIREKVREKKGLTLLKKYPDKVWQKNISS